MKILDVGCGPNSVAKVEFPDEEIVRMDIDAHVKPDVVHDITRPLPKKHQGKYDIVFTSHMVEHIPWIKINDTFEHLVQAIKPGGELWLITPSLEWAAQEIMKQERCSPVILGQLFGGQANEHDFHRSGYTLLHLRKLAQDHGLVVRKAGSNEYRISTATYGVWPAGQNFIIAMKPPQEDENE